MMKLRSNFWANLSSKEFSEISNSPERDKVVAVLPVAAIEQHGPHLPVSVDQTLVDGVISACLPHLPADVPVLFLPTQAIGKSNEHIRFPGTVSLSTQTLLALWMDIGTSVARTGIRKLLLFNSHGGQVSAMDLVARDLRAAHDILVFSSNWYQLPTAEVMAQFPAQEQRFGVHAGDIETSMMLALQPEWVDMSRAQHFVSQAQVRAKDYPLLGSGTSAKMGWQMQDYHPQGAAGDASSASAEKGRRLLNSAGEQLALLLAEISRLPMSALVDRPSL